MDFKDYYSILGVERDATAEDVKKAFRRLARQYHPDVARDKAGADAKFKEINEAYEVLGDPEKRRKYDQLGQEWNMPAYGGAGDDGEMAAAGGARAGRGGNYQFGGSTGFSDFFEQFFGGGAGAFDDGFAPHDGFAPRRGANLEADLLVTIDEALRGSERLIRMESRDGQAKTLRVRIPAGIRAGARLRVAGQGGEGAAGGAAGDLYLRIRFAAHPDYRVVGDDLYYELTLAPWEAALGATVTIPLPGGRQGRVQVPAGSGSGRQLRLRGLGLPARQGAGDLYVSLAIAMPDNPSPAHRALWEKLARETGFNPRAES